MSIKRPPLGTALRLLAGLVLIAQSGCMSALTTASLRELLLDTADSLAEATARDVDAIADDADASASLAQDGTDGEAIVPEPAERLSLDEAVDRAVARLNGVGELDPATQATLLSILENTNPQDWPAAIDAFTASLEMHRPPRPIAAPTPPPVVPVAAVEPEPHDPLTFPVTAAAHELTFPTPEPATPEPATLAFVEAARPVSQEQFVSLETMPPGAIAPVFVAEPVGAEDPLVIEPAGEGAPSAATPPVHDAPASPTFTVRNACFVTRVRAWGVVDRFPAAAFRPGQDVIVYFELDAPTARQSAAGHTTSIDTLFRLISADGRQLGEWNFEPIDETCHAPRRDYFARYFLRIPETAQPGACRLEFVVTDRVTGISTPAHLDLDVR